MRHPIVRDFSTRRNNNPIALKQDTQKTKNRTPALASHAEPTPLRILVTSGPTREPIDPVRFISNRSSGKMGHALAARAQARGHKVRLISGPVCIPPPSGIAVCHVLTAAEMLQQVLAALQWADCLIMAAAVADWTPAEVATRKLKKGQPQLTLKLRPTADILRTIAPRKGNRLFVGFAAETHNLLSEARRKLHQKNLDLIVANDVSSTSSGFESDNNRATLIDASGSLRRFRLGPKTALADKILDWIECSARNRATTRRRKK